MNVSDLLLAPVRAPLRLVRTLDDIAAIADRARRDPDPLETTHALLVELLAETRSLGRVAQRLDMTGRDLHAGGEGLTSVAKALEVDTRVLVDGGEDLTAVSERIQADLRVFRAALPRLLRALDTVEELESAVETVAETIEPLQGTAERVGRVTQKLSRTG